MDIYEQRVWDKPTCCFGSSLARMGPACILYQCITHASEKRLLFDLGCSLLTNVKRDVPIIPRSVPNNHTLSAHCANNLSLTTPPPGRPAGPPSSIDRSCTTASPGGDDQRGARSLSSETYLHMDHDANCVQVSLARRPPSKTDTRGRPVEGVPSPAQASRAAKVVRGRPPPTRSSSSRGTPSCCATSLPPRHLPRLACMALYLCCPGRPGTNKVFRWNNAQTGAIATYLSGPIANISRNRTLSDRVHMDLINPCMQRRQHGRQCRRRRPRRAGGRADTSVCEHGPVAWWTEIDQLELRFPSEHRGSAASHPPRPQRPASRRPGGSRRSVPGACVHLDIRTTLCQRAPIDRASARHRRRPTLLGGAARHRHDAPRLGAR
jgi:hypothetical protein